MLTAVIFYSIIGFLLTIRILSICFEVKDAKKQAKERNSRTIPQKLNEE